MTAGPVSPPTDPSPPDAPPTTTGASWLARELHDVLGHHISLITVQAGVALHLLDDDPELARAALVAIRRCSRDLLGELRIALGALRRADAGMAGPAPALPAHLDELIAHHRAAGLDITLETRGVPHEVPQSVAQAAYRIVQEALTNARKHAAPAAARVLLHHADGALVVQVEDDGSGCTPGGAEGQAGFGLVGMRERASALGGSCSAGPRPDGGFTVRAWLPCATG